MPNRRPQLQLVTPTAGAGRHVAPSTPEEAAAVIAAVEQFLRDHAPPAAAAEPESGWVRAARTEAVDREPSLPHW